jgi:hypothetical protein
MKFCIQLLAVLICLQFRCAFALDLDTVSPIKLQEITSRGKLLAEYDKAAARGTDAVFESYPEASKKHLFHQFLANNALSGWTVSFGTLSSDGSSFEVAYDAIEDQSTGKYKVVNYATPRKDTGVLLNEARAVKSCLAVFPPNGKTNNYAILPAGSEQMYVYIYPAQTVPNIYPLGGDMRYLVTANGNKIVESRRMHKSILENPPPPAGQSAVMGFHSAVMADIPEDTDVFHVLVRKPSIPEMIATERFAYRIEHDGSIKYLGTAEEVFKRSGK